eukprot:GEMP01013310.1.p1 GENE.GEMP01013310.1~~GEMP01013310.1.p1  ORF type:complete len:311 (+),score=50.38 GEMP01013310.1:393-1325(+)
MNDRLIELRSSLGGITLNETLLKKCDTADDFEIRNFDVEEPKMVMVLTAKDTILRTCIATVERVVQDMNKVILEQRVATSSKKEFQLSTIMTNLLEEGKRELNSAKGVIEELRKIEIDFCSISSPAEKQMCNNILMTASSRFKSVLQDYMKANETYKGEMMQKLRRQLKITYPNAKDEEIESLMCDDFGTETARDAIAQRLAGASPFRSLASVSNDLQAVQARYNALQKLENAACELQELFAHLETLAQHNQAYMDSIERTVNETTCYTEQAQDDIRELSSERTRYKRRRLFLIALALGFAIFIILYISV